MELSPLFLLSVATKVLQKLKRCVKNCCFHEACLMLFECNPFFINQSLYAKILFSFAIVLIDWQFSV
jgi:hypothetical protein